MHRVPEKHFAKFTKNIEQTNSYNKMMKQARN